MEQQKPNYKIRQTFWSRFWIRILYWLDEFFNFFSLRKTERFWGVVYDSISKQPLDPVIVKLLYNDGREIETCVTDLNGRYGFLARPGKFKIFARKSNYIFPSTLVSGDSDGIYHNLYHGEFFTLANDSEVLAPNIPMDPQTRDWNQDAKLQLVHVHAYWELFLKRLVALVFWFGLVLVGLLIWKTWPNVPFVYFIVVAAYILIIFLSKALPEPRLWGRIIIKDPGLHGSELLMELQAIVVANVTFGKALVHEDGRFLLRAPAGAYNLRISLVDNQGGKKLIATRGVKVGNRGVLASSLILKKLS